MKQVEVRIMGQNYILGCTEGAEAELLDAVRMVDKEMCDIRDGGKLRARERIAVLAALNIALSAGKITTTTQEPTIVTPDDLKMVYNDLILQIDEALSDDGRLL